MKHLILFLFVALLPPALSPAATITGRILEKGIRAPVVGADLLLKEVPPPDAGREPSRFTVGTDTEGHYAVVDIPEGLYEAVVAAPGYERIVLNDLYVTGDMHRDHYLQRAGFELPEIAVIAKRLPRTSVSRQVISRDELVKVPGSAQDVLRALESLPGVVTANDSLSVLLVRGGGPNDNLYYLDRIPYAFPYHFGGILSALDSGMVRGVDFSAGGFGPEFGNCWGGVVDVTQRDPRRDRWGGRADLTPLLLDLQAEGPTGERHALALSVRRSYLEAASSLFDDFTAIPSIADYQTRWAWEPSFGTRLDLQAFGSDDRLGVDIGKDSAAARTDAAYEGEFRFHNYFHSQGANLERRFGDRHTLLVTPYHYDFRFDTAMEPNLFYELGLEDCGLRCDWLWRSDEEWILRVGSEIEHLTVTMDAHFPPHPPEQVSAVSRSGQAFDINLSLLYADRESCIGFNRVALYTEHSRRFFGRLWMAFGARWDRMGYNRTQDTSPRVSAAYDLTPRTSLKASWGLYHQFAIGPELDPEFGNPGIRSNRADVVVLGLEQTLTEDLQIRVEGYAKELSRIAVPDEEVRYSNKGRGYTNGVEVFLRRAPSERFFGWISYAKSVSWRQDSIDTPWYLYDHDRPHIGTLVASYRMTPRWEGGLKWRYASGEPETPIALSFYDEGRYWPVYGFRNTARKPAYHRLDLSLSREALYEKWRLRWYLEVLNVYDSKNIIGYKYNSDYTKRIAVRQLPFLPYVGVEVRF